MKWSTSPHRPPHLYVDDTWYFVTASTRNKSHVLTSSEHFNLWLKALEDLIAEFNIRLAAWVVLRNHYHLLVLPRFGNDLGSFIKRLNGRTSFELNSLDCVRGRSVWYSYWDTCIRGERDFWTRFNYIHYNPIKHGYVDHPEEWKFSSYQSCLQDEGNSRPMDCAREFPVVDLLADDKF